MRIVLPLICSGVLLAQVPAAPVFRQCRFGTRPVLVHLAPRFATAIRMPEAVSSVIVGDPAKFLAEHSDKEPALVLVKPVVEGPAESNLLITTVHGRQASFVLRSRAGNSNPVDFLLTYRSAGTFLVGESDIGSMEVPGTATLSAGELQREPLARAARFEAPDDDPLAGLLARQQRAPLPVLYGPHPPSPEGNGDRIRAGVSEVLDRGATVVVLFSVVNPQRQPVELLPPQVQLAGKVRKGAIIRHSRWGTSEQLPVQDFRLSRRRLSPGKRADGVVVFRRPGFKQSNESLFLQMAESGAVDKPALAPIGFGVSATKEMRDGE